MSTKPGQLHNAQNGHSDFYVISMVGAFKTGSFKSQCQKRPFRFLHAVLRHVLSAVPQEVSMPQTAIPISTDTAEKLRRLKAGGSVSMPKTAIPISTKKQPELRKAGESRSLNAQNGHSDFYSELLVQRRTETRKSQCPKRPFRFLPRSLGGWWIVISEEVSMPKTAIPISTLKSEIVGSLSS